MARPPKTPIHDGLLDKEQLDELLTSYTEVSVNIMRRNDRGQLASVLPSITVATALLATFDAWLMEEAGGGRYLVTVRSPADPTIQLVRFQVSVEGAPRPAKSRMGAPMPVVGESMQQMPPTPGWAQGLNDPAARAQYMGRPAPGASVPSDALAMRELQDSKARAAKLEERLRMEEKASSAKVDAFQKQMDTMQRQMIEQQHKNELQLVREQMERQQAETKAMLQAMQEQSAKPRFDNANQLQAYAAIAAAVAPVFATMVSSSKEASTKGMELQSQGVNALMQATLDQNSKPDGTMEMVKTLAPLVLPLVQNMMTQKSPEAQAALFGALSENQLNSVAMMAQLIEAFAGNQKEEPWWLPMIQETLQGAVSVGEAMVNSQGEAAAAPMLVPPGVPAPQQAAPQQATPPAQGVVYTTEEPTAAPTNGAAQPVAMPAAMAALLPTEFKTPEWQMILEHIHNVETTAEQVAELLAEHLRHCVIFSKLPSQMADLQSDPAGVLDKIVSVLPVSKQDAARAEAIVRATVSVLDEMGILAEPEPIAEPVEAAAAEPIDVPSEEIEASVRPSVDSPMPSA